MSDDKEVKKTEPQTPAAATQQAPAKDDKKAEAVAKLKAEADAQAAKKPDDKDDNKDELVAEKPKARPSDVFKLEKGALEGKKVETVYGLMVDGSNGHHYDRAASKVYEDNGWLRMQIAAGKIRIVD